MTKRDNGTLPKTNPVGYGKPPEQSRFQRGKSGNPNGRPKGILNFATALQKTLREIVVITENGRRKEITKLEAAVKQLVNKRCLRQLARSGSINRYRAFRRAACRRGDSLQRRHDRS